MYCNFIVIKMCLQKVGVSKCSFLEIYLDLFMIKNTAELSCCVKSFLSYSPILPLTFTERHTGSYLHWKKSLSLGEQSISVFTVFKDLLCFCTTLSACGTFTRNFVRFPFWQDLLRHSHRGAGFITILI